MDSNTVQSDSDDLCVYILGYVSTILHVTIITLFCAFLSRLVNNR